MSGSKKLVLLRLQKQQKKLKDQPIEQAWVAREGLLNFHFCIYGLDGAYEGGYYHDYPFAPPKLMFFTPSGRFEVSKPICTTFTNFHKESWTSSWNVRTMVLATISFMTSNQHGAGSVQDSYLTKRSYARSSLQHNIKNPLFMQLFKRQLNDHRLKSKQISKQSSQSSNPTTTQLKQNNTYINNNLKLYILYFLLALCVISFIFYKN